jgi:hypothetical protein
MKDTLDNLLQQSAQHELRDAPVASWPVITAALHKKKKRRIFWIFFLTTLLLSTGIALFYVYGKKEDKLPDYSQNINMQENIAKPLSENMLQDTAATVNIDKNNKNTEALSTVPTEITKTDNGDIIMAQSPVIKKDKTNFNKGFRKIYLNENRIKNSTAYKISKRKISDKKKAKYFLVNVDEADTKQDDKQLKEFSALVIANYKGLSLPQAKLDNIMAIKQMQINTPNNQPKKENIKPKWKLYYVVTGGTTMTNLFKKEIVTTTPTNNLSAGPLGLVQNTITLAAPKYENGLFLSGTVLFKKEQHNKKIQPQFGVTVQYNQFNVKAYRATPASVIDNVGVLRVDSTVLGNSFFLIDLPMGIQLYSESKTTVFNWAL